MPSKIDSVGTYRVTTLEGAVSETKNGLPQFVGRFKFDEKFVEEKSELEYFKLDEPQFVDYSTFDYEDLGYFVLYNNDGPLLNAEQIEKAYGWDGTSFETLPEITKGKQVLVRVEETEYQGKKSIRIQWIDAADASPTRTLKALDSASLKSLSSKFITKKAAVVPAKAPSKAGATPPKPVSAPVVTTPSSSGAASAASSVPKKAPAGKKKAPPVAEPEVAEGLPVSPTMEQAWEYLNVHKGETEDSDLETAWIVASGVVGGDLQPSDFTPEQWGQVVAAVVKELELK